MTDSPYIVEVTEENFQSVILEGSMQQPVLIDFWASWCQPCQALMPVLAKLADEYQGKFLLGKLNTEEEQEIAAQVLATVDPLTGLSNRRGFDALAEKVLDICARFPVYQR